MSRFKSTIVAAALGLVLPGLAFSSGSFDSHSFGGLRARALGPAVMSGRIAAIDGAAGAKLTLYVGAAGGGVWKSQDGGLSFKPVFDKHTQSIGAIRIDPSETETVWVGTGESWTRNSVSVGDGVYRSTDGGESWRRMGLEQTERIAKIEVDPGDSSRVFVCATGHLWNGNPERGVYRTTDGGKSWTRVLFVDEDTGCSDLAMDPQNPQVLYAGMWQFRRSPDFFDSGGPGSGLYRSTDGGEHWARLSEGLPEGELGRITVAVAPSRPSTVYAVIESEKTALYVSHDLGASWVETNDSFAVQARPFYFGRLVVDPVDYKTLYKPGFSLAVSTDGGETFSGTRSGSVHPDHHALWINPKDTRNLVLGTDGGVYISRDGGAHWRFVRDLPVSQFYHVAYDLRFPYNVYGGLQDNGSWAGPSRAPGGVKNRHWRNVGMGDGFWAQPIPEDPNTLYVEYQGGEISRVDQKLGTSKSIKPYRGAGEEELRFNWNAPILVSRHDGNTVYIGSQYLHRSRDRGESWETISLDLSTDDPAQQRQLRSGGLTIDNSTAENHCTIFALAESPLDPDVLWAGTDDGRLHVTRDGGKSWAEVGKDLGDLPAGTWVSSVDAGAGEPGRAMVTFDGHRKGDMSTYLYATGDYGKSWTRLDTSQVRGYAHVIKQDPVNPSLLLLGTEHGLWISLDGGGHWARFTENLPPVSVRDLTIQPREQDLILATHGRGLYVIDDITALRAMNPQMLEESVALLASRPARMVIESSLQEFPADDEFIARNPPEAAIITYYLKKRHLFGDLKVEIYDQQGKLLSTLPGRKRPGLNRVYWPMRLDPPKVPPANALVPAFRGPRLPEGKYEVRLIKGKRVLEGTVELGPDPRTPYSAEDRGLQQRTALRIYGDLEDLTFLIDDLIQLRDGARGAAKAVGGKGKLARDLKAFAEALEKQRATLVATGKGGMLSGEKKLREYLGALYGAVNGYDGRPTRSQVERVESLEGQLGAARARFDEVAGAALGSLSPALERKGLEPLERLDRESWKGRKQGVRGSGGAVVRSVLERISLGFLPGSRGSS